MLSVFAVRAAVIHSSFYSAIRYSIPIASGNDWGCDAGGVCGMGRGPNQEKFYSCADVAITNSGISSSGSSGSGSAGSGTGSDSGTNSGWGGWGSWWWKR